MYYEIQISDRIHKRQAMMIKLTLNSYCKDTFWQDDLSAPSTKLENHETHPFSWQSLDRIEIQLIQGEEEDSLTD